MDLGKRIREIEIPVEAPVELPEEPARPAREPAEEPVPAGGGSEALIWAREKVAGSTTSPTTLVEEADASGQPPEAP